MNQNALLASLSEMCRKHLDFANRLLVQPDAVQQARPHAAAWSALECLEHLNRYGDFYHPEIERAIRKAPEGKSAEYQPGFLGNYFANSMLPGPQLNKMKTFKDKNPIHESLGPETITRFIQQQQLLLQYLSQSAKVDLGKVKTGITLTSMIRLKLGDTLRFLVNHQERHILQAAQAAGIAG